MRVRAAVVGVAAVVVVFAGCSGADNGEDPTVRSQSRADVEAATRAHLGAATEAIGEGLPDPAPSVAPAPCDGYRDHAVFHVSGFSHVTLPVERHAPVLERLRDEWTAKGYELKNFRLLPEGAGAELDLVNPADGFQFSWTTSGDRVWIALIVMSPCVRSPDGKYPG
ncbi:hypothetical protein AAH979_36995 [Plantactinospora sp. ZYX-F-223]|uniref:hypothetical protein n=1 Tax=Plantactinospora sp. ZYX-F-223 TaxID=3144103 RepID=UPI0031FDCACC